jgi:3-methyladenine DNA glycosylase AlkD
MLQELKQELQKLGNLEDAQHAQRFFKTGKDQYGEGDVFLGISVPKQRKVANKYDLNFEEIQNLLNSEIHEHRLVGLFILIRNKNKEGAFRFYLKNISRINNWDLVDYSAHRIVGGFLLDKDRKVLYELAKSDNLWEKRIAMISTFAFIQNNQFEDTLAIAEILLNDSHDLIHKAVGWMLREVGKKNQKVLEDFLKKHYSNIPRTTLRYAIERFEEKKRKKFLKGKI